jgi:hypothetical protein
MFSEGQVPSDNAPQNAAATACNPPPVPGFSPSSLKPEPGRRPFCCRAAKRSSRQAQRALLRRRISSSATTGSTPQPAQAQIDAEHPARSFDGHYFAQSKVLILSA